MKILTALLALLAVQTAFARVEQEDVKKQRTDIPCSKENLGYIRIENGLAELCTSDGSQQLDLGRNNKCLHNGDTAVIGAPLDKRGALVLSCINNRWQKTGTVGETPINVRVKIMEGESLLSEIGINGLDGEPNFTDTKAETSYIAKYEVKEGRVISTLGKMVTGLEFKALPTLADGSKITVDFGILLKSVAGTAKPLKIGNAEYQSPTLIDSKLNQKITLDNGQEIAIPFGPLTDQDDPASNQYTLFLTAAFLP